MNNNYENNNNSKSRTNKNSRVEFAEDMNFVNRATTSQSQIVVQILIALITQILTHLIQIQTADSLILNKKQGPRTLFF